jgi:hypothetical protein
MRCLYCGKELALFKRLTGGAEFCSDAHRQKYQEEYNQLALSRLLQASPVGEGSGKNALSKGGQDRGAIEIVSETQVEDAPVQVGYGLNGNGSNGPTFTNGTGSNGSYHAHDEHAHEDHARGDRGPENYRSASEPEEVFTRISEDDEEAPAGPSGFLVEIFEPHFALEPVIAVSESDFVWSERPALPQSGMTTTLDAKPGFAGAVPLEKSVSALNSHGNTRAPSLEVREMGRGISVNTDFPELVSSGLEASSRPMEISFAWYAPPDPAVLWEEAAKEFPRFETQLGDLCRLAFATLGWDEIARNEGIALPAAPPAASVAPVAEPEPEPQVAAEVVEEVQASSTIGTTVEEPKKEEPKKAEPEKETEALSAAEVNPPAPEEVKQEEEKQPEADPIPSAITRPLPMTLHGHAPGRGKPAQVFPSVVARTAIIQIPRSSALPLRPAMVFGPAPATTKETLAKEMKEAVAKEKSVAPAPVEAAKPVETAKPAPAPPPAKKEVPASPARADIKTLIKPAVQVKVGPPEKKEAEKPAAAPPPPAADKGKQDLAAIRKAEERKGEARKAEERKEEERKAEARKEEERKAEARKAEERKEEARKAEERKEEDRKAAEERKAEARKADERKMEQLKAAREEQARKEAAEAKAKKESSLPTPIAPSYTDMDLGLPSLGADRAAPQGFWSKLPVFAKASVGAAVLVAAAVGGLYYSKQQSATDNAAKGPTVVAAGNVLSSGGAGWDTDWAPDPPNSKRQRRVSLMNASQSLSDYRMELEGQIETKAMGWVFRASNPKNFYVEKIEIVKPGLNPTIQLVHFAVIDSVEQPHKAVPMNIPVRPDTLYKVRFEAIGDRFTTWVLDQKVDEWTDGRISTGGVGLYAEAGESLSLKGALNVVPLIVKH